MASKKPKGKRLKAIAKVAEIVDEPELESDNDPRAKYLPFYRKEKQKGRSNAGRPTNYKPEYCDAIIAHMAKGYSIESFAGSISVHKDTVYNWAKLFPEFSDAVGLAKQACFEFWENLGFEGMANKIPFFRHQMWIFWMSARFGIGAENANNNEMRRQRIEDAMKKLDERQLQKQLKPPQDSE